VAHVGCNKHSHTPMPKIRGVGWQCFKYLMCEEAFIMEIWFSLSNYDLVIVLQLGKTSCGVSLLPILLQFFLVLKGEVVWFLLFWILFFMSTFHLMGAIPLGMFYINFRGIKTWIEDWWLESSQGKKKEGQKMTSSQEPKKKGEN
jgi:hypothetical protein